MSSATDNEAVFAAGAKQLHHRFVESYFALTGFVAHTQASFDTLMQSHAAMTGAVAQLETGYVLDVKSGRGRVEETITLEEHDVQKYKDVMAWVAGQVGQYPSMLLEMAFVYLIAAFDAFMQDIVELVLVTCPSALKSSKQLTIEKIVDLTQRGELIHFLARREVQELGYRSITEQLEYYRSKFNLDLALSGLSVDHVTEIYARRNMYVHNAGIVNRKYLDVTPTTAELGERLELSPDYWRSANVAIGFFEAYVYRHLMTKFGGTELGSGAAL